MKAAFSIQLQGYPAANRDAKVRLVNQATGAVVERQVFLDGTALIRDLDPGPYELEVLHPNLIQPIARRPIRIFPQRTPTKVSIPVPADLFRDTPIRDIPDADLGPIQQLSADVRSRVLPIQAKSPGEAIRAEDWNVLVGAVSDLAGAVLELTQLVSPVGHAHPEIAEKIGEVQGNLQRFAEAFGRSLLELRREVETANLNKNIRDVLDLVPNAPEPVRQRFNERIADLEKAAQSDSLVFTKKLAAAGNLFLNDLNDLAVAQGDGADQFLAQPAVQTLLKTSQQYSQTGTQIRPEAELSLYQKTTAASGGKKFNNLFGG